MRKLLVCLGILLLIACSSNDKLPPDILPLNTMKTIIWDMTVAGNLASDKYVLRKDSQRIMTTGLYRKVFDLHKINKAAFYKSYGYYEAHPQELKILFDSISNYGMRQKSLSYQKGL